MQKLDFYFKINDDIIPLYREPFLNFELRMTSRFLEGNYDNFYDCGKKERVSLIPLAILFTNDFEVKYDEKNESIYNMTSLEFDIEDGKYFQNWMHVILNTFEHHSFHNREYKRNVSLWVNDTKLIDFVGCFPKQMQGEARPEIDVYNIELAGDYFTFTKKFSLTKLIEINNKFKERRGDETDWWNWIEKSFDPVI